jgi:hypothetical protein
VSETEREGHVCAHTRLETNVADRAKRVFLIGKDIRLHISE